MTLASGADLKSTNRYGGTALIPAAHHGHVETVRELLKTRIDSSMSITSDGRHCSRPSSLATVALLTPTSCAC